MTEKYEAIILCRNDIGRFAKQIKLGENFLSDINKMAADIFQANENYVALSNQLNSLNWKINSMVSNRIQYNLKGINFTDSSEKISSISANNFAKVIENISEGLYALINDFECHRESGDPKVIKDHIIMLLLIYQKLKKNKFFKVIVTEAQREMIESQFIDCISLFNMSLHNAISQNNWNFAYNMISAFFGGCYWYKPINSLPNSYLQSCLFDFEPQNKIEDNKAYLKQN